MLPAILGRLVRVEHIPAWLQSAPVQVEALGGRRFRFVFDGDSLEAGTLDLSRAIENMLRPGPNLLESAQPFVYRYCTDTLRLLGDDAPVLAPSFRSEADVWPHVAFGEHIHVHREMGDRYVEAGVYMSIECNCAWEVEHGLQLVFRDGVEIVKVGSYDGHLTNAAAFADSRLVGTVYRSPG